MNQLQAYKRIVILSIIAAVGVWQTNLVLTGFCFAIDQNQNTATTGDSASEILLVDSKAETQNGVANKIIFYQCIFTESDINTCSVVQVLHRFVNEVFPDF